MIVISICLSDIPAHARTTARNGKIYANFVVDERRERDKYDNTHTVYVNQTKDERQAKKPKEYVGNGKEFIFNNTQQAPNAPEITQSEVNDDLPF